MPDDLRRAATRGQMRLLQRRRQKRLQEMQDQELQEPKVRAEVQGQVQEGRQEEEAAVPEDVLQRIMRAPLELVDRVHA